MTQDNFAFIDSQNLHLGIRDQGWSLDWRRFRVYLNDKYSVSKAFVFIGHVPGNEKLYDMLRSAGYILIFKPTLQIQENGHRFMKGNVDAELVLHTMIEYPNYHQAVIVSGDGDFHCLVTYLVQKHKLQRLIVPDRQKYSRLLREFSSHTTYMNRLRDKLTYKKRGIS